MDAPTESTRVVVSPSEGATTLRAIVELTRSIMHADVAGIFGFSLSDQTVTWKAAVGFRSPDIDYQQAARRPLAVDLALRALAEDRVIVFEGTRLKTELATETELSTANFPLYVAEGVDYLAAAPLRISGNSSGALTAGFRTPHRFTEDEKSLLQDLAGMASLTLDNERLLEMVSENEARLRLAQLFARIGTFEWDIQAGVNTWSPELEAMYGLQPGGRAGTQGPWEELVHPDDRAGVIASVRRAFDSLEPVESEWRVTWPDGSVRWLLGRFQLFKDGAGRPSRLTGISLDITDRKLAEDVLRESEARAEQSRRVWEKTFDAIDEGILVYDREQKIVRCNARAAEMIQMSPASAVGASFPDAFARTFGKPAADHYLANDYDFSTVSEIRTEDDRRFLVSVFPVNEPDGQSFNVVTWNDVTRASEIQEQLARSRRLAALGQLAAGVAHEVNNPLAVITTCAEAMLRNMRRHENEELAANRRWDYYLEEILRQSLRCKEMTRGLLDLTRQRRAKSILCDVNTLAEDCARVAQLRGDSQAEFEVKLDESVGQIPTDAEMVRHILDNLLGNAIDALGERQGRVTVSTRSAGEQVIVEIADTGSGVPPGLLAKIFDPFFSTKGPGKGYGLGLSICLTLAESLGGGINLESKDGEGSRFRLWLPRRAPEPA